MLATLAITGKSGPFTPVAINAFDIRFSRRGNFSIGYLYESKQIAQFLTTGFSTTTASSTGQSLVYLRTGEDLLWGKVIKIRLWSKLVRSTVSAPCNIGFCHLGTGLISS